MGGNKRYGSDVSSATLDRFCSAGPDSLWREETGARVTAAETPIPVRAWVRFGLEPVHVDAQAVAWTPCAVRVTFEHCGGHWNAWVWASAVTRR